MRWLVILSLAVGVTGLTALLVQAADKEEDEVKVKLEDCPKAVQETIKKEAAGGTIKEIEKETEKGKVVYEAEVVIGGKQYEITVAEDGKLLGKELEDDDKDDDAGDDD